MHLEQILQKYKDTLQDFYSSVDESSCPFLLGWSNKSSQTTRFQIFEEEIQALNLASHQETSILDVGCGYAELHNYLSTSKSLEYSYTGIDISEKYITYCKTRFPSVHFFVQDILDFQVNNQHIAQKIGVHTIACMSGVLNLNINAIVNSSHANLQVLYFVLERLQALTDTAIVCNFLHSKAPEKYDFFCYYTPKNLIAYIEHQGYKVLSLREDYLPNDFTLVIAHT